jgi:uncharacterized protein YecE (DUF72 family)
VQGKGPIVGTAGWAISRPRSGAFAGSGSHLQRYARVLPATEINSSAYRPHRLQTYVRWRESVPEEFHFSVKLPRTITHNRGLKDASSLLQPFAAQIRGLGAKLTVVLIQLPPSLEFQRSAAARFFMTIQGSLQTQLACEPRHPSWGSEEADALMKELSIARVAADPPRWRDDARPGGDRSLSYFRMHGAPQVYFSNYGDPELGDLAARLEAAGTVSPSVWCIFDNTAQGCALGNALHLQRLLRMGNVAARSARCAKAGLG